MANPLSLILSSPVHFKSPLIFLIFILPNLISGYGIQHGERCYKDRQRDPCDITKGLGCSYLTGTCACLDSETVYDLKKDYCVAKIGEVCSSKSKSKKSHCPSDAYCAEDPNSNPLPVCKCNEKYFPTEFGTCAKSSTEGEYCRPFHKPVQLCDPDSNLQCINRLCQCSKNEEFDPAKSLCIASLGTRCSPKLQNCGPNAYCSEKIWNVELDSTTTKVKGYRCGCQPGFTMTEDGSSCVVDYLGRCNKSEECLPRSELQCINGRCQCSPLSETYDPVKQKCVLKLGMQCSPDDPESLQCMEFSTCKKVTTAYTNDTEYMCSCREGTTQSKYRNECLLLHNENCGGHPTMCNVYLGLACDSDSGICDCADPTLTFEDGRCVAKNGAMCGPMDLQMEGTQHRDEEKDPISIYIKCMTNSTCVETPIDGVARQICVPKVFNEI